MDLLLPIYLKTRRGAEERWFVLLRADYTACYFGMYRLPSQELLSCELLALTSCCCYWYVYVLPNVHRTPTSSISCKEARDRLSRTGSPGFTSRTLLYPYYPFSFLPAPLFFLAPHCVGGGGGGGVVSKILTKWGDNTWKAYFQPKKAWTPEKWNRCGK
jgi:hypothetical protein